MKKTLVAAIGLLCVGCFEKNLRTFDSLPQGVRDSAATLMQEISRLQSMPYAQPDREAELFGTSFPRWRRTKEGKNLDAARSEFRRITSLDPKQNLRQYIGRSMSVKQTPTDTLPEDDSLASNPATKVQDSVPSEDSLPQGVELTR